jgi:PAS domain-containing protein
MRPLSKHNGYCAKICTFQIWVSLRVKNAVMLSGLVATAYCKEDDRLERAVFGKLVGALRRESRLRSESLVTETQVELARRLSLPAGTIGRIERGERVTLTPNVLLSMADAFQLTTRERRVFFLAASGVDNHNLVRASAPTAEAMLEDLRDHLVQLRVPAFVSDWHGDFLSANGAFVRLVNLSQASMESANFNLLTGVFNELGRETIRDVSWRSRAIRTVQIVRATSILNRDDPYFVRLVNRLLKNSSRFRDIWQAAYFADDDGAAYRAYEHFHTHFGTIRYLNTFSEMYTQAGPLHLVTYIPLDAETGSRFDALIRRYPELVEGHPTWPTHKQV